ncbi:MAG TPA: HAD-IIA family hydrolase [Acidimicrobiia bacterium]|nr:HAD-IIA family hydrolase [Acidimicrobiia bacterium]
MTGTVVYDLDGVVYLGETAIPGASDAIRGAERAGWRTLFATNNSARSPSAVVAKLARVCGYQAAEDQIVTSAMVAGSLVAQGPVLVMGEAGIEESVTRNGFELTDDPAQAQTVVAGLDRGITYDRIHRAALAVRSGAELIVTNRDPTFPTDQGLFPGAGACAAAVEVAAGVRGIAAGKPSEAMRRFIEGRAGDGHIWMVGDRPDTDLALAVGERWRSALVLTGVTSTATAIDPPPDVVAADLPEAIATILQAPLSP